MTTGRLRSSSQPVFSLGPSTMSASLHWKPSGLSTRAMLFLGRHENHIRYLTSSLRTDTAKHVPRLPPSTGLRECLTHPLIVSGWPAPKSLAPRVQQEIVPTRKNSVAVFTHFLRRVPKFGPERFRHETSCQPGQRNGIAGILPLARFLVEHDASFMHEPELNRCPIRVQRATRSVVARDIREITRPQSR
jgi:hypothetical protein